METHLNNGEAVSRTDEDDVNHTSSSESDNMHIKTEEVEQGIEEEEQGRTHPDPSRKRIHVDDDNTLHYADDHGHSHRSLHLGMHSHVHKRKRTSPPSASMRFYKRSLSLALRRARRQPITRSLTTRITRSGAKFFKHDQNSRPASPSSRSTNLYRARRHTPTSDSSRLHGSSTRSHIIQALKANKRNSSSKIDQNFFAAISTKEDALHSLNEDIAVRYLNSSPSFYALLDLDLDLGNEMLPSCSPYPEHNQIYLGPEMDIAIKYDDSSPKIYTLLDGIDIDLDSPTPSSPEASSPKVKDSPISSPPSFSLEGSPSASSSLKGSPSSFSPRVHNLQDRRNCAQRSPSSAPSKFKLSSHRSVDRLFSSRSPSPVYSPTSPKYAPSSQESPRPPSILRRSPSYSPTLSSSKISSPNNSPSPVYSPTSPKYAPSSQESPRPPSILRRSPSCAPTLSSSKISSPNNSSHLLYSRSRSPVRASISPKSSNHLLYSRSRSPVRASILPTYAPSPPPSGISKNFLPCPPSFKHSAPRIFKLRGSPSRSLVSSDFKSSPQILKYGFPSRSSTSSQSLSSQKGLPRPTSTSIPPAKHSFGSRSRNRYDHLSPQRPGFSGNSSNYTSSQKSSNRLSPKFASTHRRFSLSPASSSYPISSGFSPPVTNNYNQLPPLLPNSLTNSRSPFKSFNDVSPANSPTSPNFTPLRTHDMDWCQTHLSSPNKYSQSLDELNQSLSNYRSPVKTTSSPPYCPTSNAQRSSPQSSPPLNLTSTHYSPHSNSSRPPNPPALNQPSFSPQASFRTRSPSTSSQESPINDYWSQVRRTYSLFPSSPPKPSTNNSQSSLQKYPLLPQAFTSNSTSTNCSPPPTQALNQRGLDLSFSHQSRSPSTSRSQVRGKSSLSSQQGSSRSSSSSTFPSKVTTLATSSSPRASMSPTQPSSHMSSTRIPSLKREATSPPPVNRLHSAPCQRHVKANSQIASTSGGSRPASAIHTHTTHYRPRNKGKQRVDAAQNNQSRPYRSTPRPNYLRKLAAYLQTSSPSQYQDVSSLPSHNLCSPTTSIQETYYSAQSTPSSTQTQYCSAHSSPSWYQNVATSVQETYLSAERTPSRSFRAKSHENFHSRPSDEEAYYSAPSSPSRSFFNSQDTKHKELDYCPSKEEIYYSATNTPSPSITTRKTFDQCPSEQQIYYSAKSTPSPSFYDSKATMHKKFDEYPLVAGSHSPSASSSRGPSSGSSSRKRPRSRGSV